MFGLMAILASSKTLRYNVLSQWPGSDALTCWNPKGGASTVDYLMGSPSLIPEIKEFIISGRLIGLAADHA